MNDCAGLSSCSILTTAPAPELKNYPEIKDQDTTIKRVQKFDQQYRKYWFTFIGKKNSMLIPPGFDMW